MTLPDEDEGEQDEDESSGDSSDEEEEEKDVVNKSGLVMLSLFSPEIRDEISTLCHFFSYLKVLYQKQYVRFCSNQFRNVLFLLIEKDYVLTACRPSRTKTIHIFIQINFDRLERKIVWASNIFNSRWYRNSVRLNSNQPEKLIGSHINGYSWFSVKSRGKMLLCWSSRSQTVIFAYCQRISNRPNTVLSQKLQYC